MKGQEGIKTFAELLNHLARESDSMSGASLAAVARAAASHALERSLLDFAGSHKAGFGHDEYVAEEGGTIADCLVTQDDLGKAITDVSESSRGGDGVGEEANDAGKTRAEALASTEDNK